MLNQSEVNEILEKVVLAGDEAMHIWPAGKTKRPLNPQQKKDGSFVTDGDFLVNKILVDFLTTSFPQDSILSEELPYSSDIYNTARYWVIDPIDGTHNFMAGSEEFAVLLALWQGSKALFGAVYFPAKNILMHATANSPAFLNQQQLRVSSSKKFGMQRVGLLGQASLDPSYLYSQPLNSYSGTLKLCSGELDAVLIPITSHGSWDVAPIPALVEASGGKASDEHGNPFKFRVEKPDFKWMVLSNGETHAQALECLKGERGR